GIGPAWSQHPFASRATRRLGDISYGIYLFHLPLIGLALTTLHFPTGSNVDVALMTLFVVPLAIGCGYLSWRFVEQPARRWARTVKWVPKHAAPPILDRVAVRLTSVARPGPGLIPVERVARVSLFE